VLAADERRREETAPLGPMLDQFPSQEEPIGATGSSCAYPGIHIQVMSFSQQTIDAAKKRGRLAPVAEVADEAYLTKIRPAISSSMPKSGSTWSSCRKACAPTKRQSPCDRE